MKKKVILLIIIFLIVLGIIGIIIFSNNDGNGKKKLKAFNEVKEEIENNDKLLVFITTTDGTCDTCPDVGKYVDYYGDIYNLDVKYFDRSKATEDDYKELRSYMEIKPEFITGPAIITVKDGKWLSIVNDIQLERDLKNYLVNDGFIGEEELKVEEQFIKEEFEPIYNSTEPRLILFYSSEDKSYEYRKKLYDLSKEYQFNYNILYRDLGFGGMMAEDFKERDNIELNFPSLMVVQNGKVIGYTESKNEAKMVSFLKQHGIIKN